MGFPITRAIVEVKGDEGGGGLGLGVQCEAAPTLGGPRLTMMGEDPPPNWFVHAQSTGTHQLRSQIGLG